MPDALHPFFTLNAACLQKAPHFTWISSRCSMFAEVQDAWALGQRLDGEVNRINEWENVMQKLVARFMNDESGATAIEYGLIASLIAVAIIVGAKALGSQINNTFNNVANKMANPS